MLENRYPSYFQVIHDNSKTKANTVNYSSVKIYFQFLIHTELMKHEHNYFLIMWWW